MLGKLLKYEFAYTSRICGPTVGIMLLFTLLSRGLMALCGNFMSEHIRSMADALLIMLNYMMLFIGLAVVMIVLVVRFYRNLVRNQGYLMFTLPVTPTQLIVSKLIPAFVWQLAAMIVMLFGVFFTLSGMSAMADFPADEVGMYLGEGMQLLIEETGAALPIMIVQLVLLLLFSHISSILMYYASISIGQLVSKHKVVGAVVAYVGITTVMQFVSSFISIPFTLALGNSAVDNTAQMMTTANLMILVYWLVMLLTAATYFLITRFVLTKRLNLD